MEPVGNVRHVEAAGDQGVDALLVQLDERQTSTRPSGPVEDCVGVELELGERGAATEQRVHSLVSAKERRLHRGLARGWRVTVRRRGTHLARELQVALQAERVKVRAVLTELDEQLVGQARTGAIFPHSLGVGKVELFHKAQRVLLSPTHAHVSATNLLPTLSHSH